jgi:pimeloyl-ACP methyl ester carboxylesterase
MYSFIDTVSIDITSITEYHAVTNPREEGSVEAGTWGEIRLDGGVIRYREVGAGPALVFVHGILANGTLWRDVVARLSDRFRCIVPDLPLGGHSVPMSPEADMSPAGVARMVAELMEGLDLREVTLVGNDTGGAVCQIVISNHPERIGRLVLTNCDAYESFFPLLLRPIQYGARLMGTRIVDLLAWVLQARFAQRALFKTVAVRNIDETTLDAYAGRLMHDAHVRRDLARFLGSVSNRYTLEAARSFPDFDRPVLIAWGDRDPFFSPRLALRLQHDFPDARLEAVAGSRAFVPEDGPGQLTRLIQKFFDEVMTRPRGGSPEEVFFGD